MQMQEEKKMGCRENEFAEWCKSPECRMGNLRIEATKLFMQANCLTERETLPPRLEQSSEEMQMQEEKKMGCREKELAEWCKSLECRMGDLRIEATKLFMQANCLMERETLPRRLEQLNSRHDLLHCEFLLIEVHEDRLPGDIRWLRGVFNTFDSLQKMIAQIIENERKAKEFVEGLAIVTISDFHVDDGLFCGVCRDDFILGEKVREIPCMIGHIFHSYCIWPWLEDHNTCPICTTPFFMENK